MGCSLDSLYNSWDFGRRLYAGRYLCFFFLLLLLDETSLSLKRQTQVPEMKKVIRPHFSLTLSLCSLLECVVLGKKKKKIDCKLCRDYLLPELLDGLCSCNFSDGRISFTPERDVYFRMCENKALNAAERGGCQMPLRPDSEPSSSPSGLTPSGLDLRRAAGPLIYLVQASRGKRVHVSGNPKQVCVSCNQMDRYHSMLCFFEASITINIAHT